MTEDPFVVTVHGGFTEDGFWLIDAKLEWPDGPPTNGTVERGRGLLALLEAIAREGQRGRSLGARKVRVHYEGHDKIAGMVSIPDDAS
jgi:hypothetical protein